MPLPILPALLGVTLISTTPVPALSSLSSAQQDAGRLDALEARLQVLEADRTRLSTELNAAMDALATNELEGLDASGTDRETRELWSTLAGRNLGPRAASVYSANGLSIGGYGEFLGQIIQGNGGDNFDALRWVMYLGNHFSDRWIFNSEIEIEHGTTGATSATTTSNGSVSIEFAYIDHLLTDDVALRGGVVLVPLGFINERHEPTTFLPAARPQTETRIIPSTWRSTGLGGYGQVGDFAWTAYALNGLNGEEFDAKGVRGGRQKGNRASIDDIALTARFDYVGTPGVVAGISAYSGDAGVNSPEDLTTTIFDIHAEWNQGPWSVRGLFAASDISDTADFNTRTGKSVAEEMQGWYIEAGFDLLSLTEGFEEQSLDLYVRYEDLNTQKSIAGGGTPSGGIDDTFTTVGLNYRPLNQVVLKADYTTLDEGDDVARFLIGYAF